MADYTHCRLDVSEPQRESVREMLSDAEMRGVKVYLLPAVAADVREAGLWNDKVCVEMPLRLPAPHRS